ncbi:phage portal protein [Amycolatopsis methanolica]|uniref:HK97 family phage portal protein n=1 Tax=Amycolatopsis methanolica 239 TaxID=1068978 RepID=A0A076N0J7_AMYME|nr:phage portal protein [Amycolatopsis methanolica]AIJ26368.1 HK97 family phage portal protein [Amycolatopsis methanolica 239]AIJ26427.1 HK97 family phage portal protein [Amycolatopsis methanolica 239]
MTLGRAVARAITRSVENPAVPLTSTSLLNWMTGASSDAGVPVSELTALHMPAVWRSVSLISSVSAALPLHSYRESTRARTTPRLLRDPHPELTAYELWRLSYVHRVLWGNAYLQKVRNRAGEVVELWPIRPDRVQVDRVRPTDALPGGKIFQVTDDQGRQHPLTSREVLHIPGLGYDGVCGVSPIRAAAQGVGLALAAEKSGAKFFGQGAMLSGVLQTEQRLNPDQAEVLKRQWKAKHSGAEAAYDIAVLDSGASFQPITMPFRDAQFLESRRFQVVEVARMFGVPLFLLMETEKSTSWGTGLEQQALGFVQFDLHPVWLVPTEQRITKELIWPTAPEDYAEYNVEGLLRGDSKARAEFYRVMREVGAMSANDIRGKENMPPIEGGDVYLQPLNMAPLGSDPNDQSEPDSTSSEGVDDDDDPDAGDS